MTDDCNIHNLGKNQVSAVFNSCAIRRSVSSKFIEICMRGAMLVPIRIGTNMASENRQKHLSLSSATKSVHLSLEELKKIKIILFPIQEPVQIAKFPEISPEKSHFLTNSAVMEMPRHAKA